MRLVQSAMHMFTDRIDLYHRSVMQEFRNLECEAAKEKELPDIMEEIYYRPPSYYRPYDPVRGQKVDCIIEYPRAVSRFWGIRGYPDYLVAYASREGKCPALDVRYQIQNIGQAQSKQTQIIGLTWGVDGVRICKIEIRRDKGKIAQRNVFGLDEFQSRLGYLIPQPNFWEELLEDPYPTVIAEKVSEALGIFVCGREFDKFLKKKCVLTHSFAQASIYKAKG